MKRFKVALSYPREDRPLVEAVAQELASRLERNVIFYDGFHESELSRPNLDLYLQKIYHDQSQLVVVFLSEHYGSKEWCGIEFRAVRNLLKRRQDDAIMLIRTAPGDVAGLFDIDGYLDAVGKTEIQIADAICIRLDQIGRTQGNVAATTTSSASIAKPEKAPKLPNRKSSRRQWMAGISFVGCGIAISGAFAFFRFLKKKPVDVSPVLPGEFPNPVDFFPNFPGRDEALEYQAPLRPIKDSLTLEYVNATDVNLRLVFLDCTRYYTSGQPSWHDFPFTADGMSSYFDGFLNGEGWFFFAVRDSSGVFHPVGNRKLFEQEHTKITIQKDSDTFVLLPE